MRENEEKNPQNGNLFRDCALFILDYLLFLIIIPVCAIANWIGTYYFLVYLNKPELWYCVIKISLITICVIIFAAKHVFRGLIYKYIRDHVESEVKFYIVSKIYIYIFSLCSTVVFVGIFESKTFTELITFKKNPEVKLIDDTTNGSVANATSGNVTSATSTSTEEAESDPIYCTIITAVGFLLLLCLKCRPHLAGGAGDIGREKTAEDVFLFPTTFSGTTWKKNKCLYILDSIFSVFIVGTLVILVWRGAWCLLDQTIFPGDQTYLLSGWISLGIGYSIVFATFALQRFMKILIRMYHGWKRLIIIDTYVVISFCGTINIWRGIWILLETYADLENSLLNCVILHFLSFFILVIFNSSNTLLVRGVYIDAEENGEDCVEFPCYYFRLRFQEKQKKKTLVELNMVTNQIHNVDEKDDSRLNQLDKKPETEIISEINHQQIPLILSNAQNGNGEVGLKNQEKSDS